MPSKSSPAGRPATSGKRPTIRDVARRAGVDPSLVSRIVNNDPRAASTPETRQRVLDAVKELGYAASVAARSLRFSRTVTVGLLLPNLSNPMYVSIVRGTELAARELGYGLVIRSQVDSESRDELTSLLRDGRVDGLLVASGSLHDEVLRQAAVSGPGPVVLVNRNVSGVPASVTVDDAAGAALAVEHLAELGHRAIVGLFGPSDIDTTVRRRRGFVAASRARGVRAIVNSTGSWTAEAGLRATAELLARPTRPTAVFASTIAMGLGALRAATEAGVRVPDELSVITLHDSDLLGFLTPALTAVAMPSEEMGRLAMGLLHELADGGRPRRIVVATRPQLRERESTAPPFEPNNRLTKRIHTG